MHWIVIQITNQDVLFSIALKFVAHLEDRTCCFCCPGAVKLSSECPDERKAAVYLFVKAIFGFLFLTILAVLRCKTTLTRAIMNPFVEVFIVVEATFSLVWFLLGK